LINQQTIKNIIFDLGQVIINLDLDKTMKAFAHIGNLPYQNVLEKWNETNFWHQHEMGFISDQEFRKTLKQWLGDTIFDVEIDDAWNELLLDIPKERLKLIEQLSKKYRLFLLSNTNAIHIDKVNAILKQTANIDTLEYYFEKTYYSHLMGLRKPNPHIYRQVLNENNLLASETVFVDDNLANIVSARDLGIYTIHVQPPFTITDLLSDYIA
jgi:glucose-1-phosphatase